MHGGDQQDSKADEDPDQSVEHVNVGDNTVAKLRKRLLLRSLSRFGLRLLLLDDFSPVDLHGLLGILSIQKL